MIPLMMHFLHEPVVELKIFNCQLRAFYNSYYILYKSPFCSSPLPCSHGLSGILPLHRVVHLKTTEFLRSAVDLLCVDYFLIQYLSGISIISRICSGSNLYSCSSVNRPFTSCSISAS